MGVPEGKLDVALVKHVLLAGLHHKQHLRPKNPSARAASAPASPVCRAAAAARGALAAGVGAGAPQGCR